MSEIIVVPDEKSVAEQRTLDQIAIEIRGYSCLMAESAIEIGRRLCEAKEMVPYGEFGKWVKDNTGYSSSAANRFMKIFKEMAKPQGSLFGAETECPTLGKLSYTKAMALLELPADEREEFAKEHDIENKSTREVQALIKQRDDAVKAAGDAQHAEAEAVQALAEAEEKRQASETLLDNIKKKFAASEADRKAAQKELEEFKKKPVIPSDMLSKIQKDAADKATADLTERTAQAELAAATAMAQLEQMKKELAASSVDITAFKIHFTNVQNNFSSLFDSLEKVQHSDMGTAQKLCAATIALLREMANRLSPLNKDHPATPLPGQTEMGG